MGEVWERGWVVTIAQAGGSVEGEEMWRSGMRTAERARRTHELNACARGCRCGAVDGTVGGEELGGSTSR